VAITFQSVGANAGNAQCLGTNGNDNHNACPSTSGFPTDDIYTYGPMPAGGVTISELFVHIDAAAAGSGNLVEILDNGTAVLSCTVTSGNTTCTNTGSASIAEGHYLQARVTNNSGAANRKYRVSIH
jgi:hypothetical protein